MKNNKIEKIENDLVLLGAGHANISVLKYIGALKLKGIRITLITDNLFSTYSGMIPGFIQGEYTWKEINIDVYQLSHKYNVRVIRASVTNIKHKEKKIYLSERPPLNYDILSINLGITAKKANIQGASKHSYSLKPISNIKQTIDKTLKHFKSTKTKQNLVIIGAGAAGVEVSLAFNRRFKNLKLNHQIYLISKNKNIVKNFGIYAQKKLVKIIEKNKIILLTNARVNKITRNYVEINKNQRIHCKNAILSTSPSPPDWLHKTDLTLSLNKFILVDNTLKVKDVKGVFAAGDIIDIENFPSQKAGVFAVKQGRILKKNILSFIKKKSMRYYYPQKKFVSILGISDNTALLNRGNNYLHNKYLWSLKKIIDKRFINKYTIKTNNETLKSNESEDPYEFDMQCSGCASKVPQKILKLAYPENISRGSLDAEMIPTTQNLFQTIDVISDLTSDPFKLGRIAVKHAINDIIATNSKPLSAQMILGIKPSNNKILVRDIVQIKEGALSYMKNFDCNLSGGHTFYTDTQQTFVGFSVIGKKIIKNFTNEIEPNSKILLTNKIGSAMVLAGIRRNMICSEEIIDIEKQMMSNNIEILKVFNKYNITSLTDVSGFGVAIHLSNLLKRYDKNNGADIYLDKINVFQGVHAAIQKNIISSLNNSNKFYLKNYLEITNEKNPLLNIIFDPQTAGGFLFTYNGNVDLIKKELYELNIPCAVIGKTNKRNKIRVF